MVTLAASLVIAVTTAALPSQGFSPIGEKNGVTVYRREPARGIELGAEGDIDAPPEAVRAVLLDYEDSPRWVKGLRESRVLRREDHALDVYQRLDLPVIDDRDFTLHVTWGEQGDTLWLRFQAANDRGPAPVHGVVRVPTHEGQWLLTPIDGGRRTHAVYRFHLDLAGSLPGWMGKGRAGKDLPTLFENVRREALARARTDHAQVDEPHRLR